MSEPLQTMTTAALRFRLGELWERYKRVRFSAFQLMLVRDLEQQLAAIRRELARRKDKAGGRQTGHG